MNQEEHINTDEEKKPRKKRKRRILLWLSIVLLGIVILFQLAFLLFSDQLFGRVIKEVVYQGSDGIYKVSYEDVKFNVFKNEMGFSHFKLIPDSSRFFELRGQEGRTNRLLTVDCPNLVIKGPSLLKLYMDEVLEIEEFTVDEPYVEMRVYGEFRTGNSGLRNFHEVLTQYLRLLKVESYQLNSANVKLIKVTEKSRNRFDFNDISVSLSDFELDNTGSADSLLSLGDMRVSLGENRIRLDSINQLSFASLSLEVKDSVVKVDSIDFRPLRGWSNKNETSFEFSEVMLEGVDFWKLYSSKKASVRQLTANNGAVDAYRAMIPDSSEVWNKIQRYFDTVSISKLKLSRSSVHYLKAFGKKRPDVTAPINYAVLSGFQLDSQSFIHNKLNFYSRDVNLGLDPFHLYSADSSQKINIHSLNLSTLNRELLLFDVNIESFDRGKGRSRIDGNLKSVQLFGVDPMTVVLKNQIIARAALLEDPDFTVTKGVDNKGFSNNTFNQSIRKQFRYINVSNVEVSNGNLEIKSRNGFSETQIKDLALFSKSFKTYRGNVPARKYLLSDLLTAEAGSIRTYLPDGLHIVTARSSKIFSDQGGLYFDNLDIRLKNGVPDSIVAINNVIREGNFTNLSIDGLDFDAMFYEQRLMVKNILSKGNNTLNMELNAKPNGKRRGIWSVDIAEMNIDSVDTRIVSSGADELLFQSKGVEFQACDLRWDSTYTKGRFDIYSMLIDGNEVVASSKNSRHALEAKKIKMNTVYGLFQLNNPNLQPFDKKPSGKNVLWYSANQFRFNGLDLTDYFSNRNFDAENFYCLNPVITYHNWADSNDEQQSFLRNPFNALSKYTSNAHIGNVRVHHGAVKLYQYKGEKEITYDLDELNLYMQDFVVDSFTIHTDTNVFFAQETELSFKHFERRANDTSMVISLDAVKSFPHNDELVLEGLELHNRKPETSLKRVEVISETAHLIGFNYHDFLLNNRVRCDKIEFVNSELTIGSDERNTDKSQFFKRDFPQALTKDYSSIRADSLLFKNATVKLRHRDKETKEVKTEKISGWEIQCRYFNIHRNLDRLNFLYSINTKVFLRDYERELDDGLNSISLKEGVFEPHSKRIVLRDCRMTPKYEKMLYGRTYGKQIDRIELKNNEAIVNGFDFEKWLYTGVYHARDCYIKKTDVSVFRDKTLDEERGLYRQMPQEALRNLPFEIKIDEIHLDEWHVTYEEQIGTDREPGFIEFNNLEATIEGISNARSDTGSSEMVNIVVNTGLMENGVVDVTLDIPLNHPDDEFGFKGSVSNMDMREINPLLENLVGIKIVSGQTYGMEFDGKADRYMATGNVDMTYSNLDVVFVNNQQDTTTWQKIKNKAEDYLTSRFIKVLVRTGNKAFPKSGKIYWERNPEKSIFNYGAKALLSGIKASIARRIINRNQKPSKNGTGTNQGQTVTTETGDSG